MPKKQKKRILIDLEVGIISTLTEMSKVENNGAGSIKAEIEKIIKIKALNYYAHTNKSC